jgi:hypothetical protein
MDDYLVCNVKDVMRLLRVGRSRAYAIMQQLPRVGGLGWSERVPRWAVERWLKEHTEARNRERPILAKEEGRSVETGDVESEAKSTTGG